METVEFKHFKPIIYTAVNIIGVGILAISAYFLLNHVNLFVAVYILFLLFGLLLLFIFLGGRKLEDMSGQFIFSDNYFEIIYFRVNIKLYYSDIAEIRRETYEESHPISWLVPYTHISQTNLNQYAIIMKSGKKYIFRVSKNEERH